MLKVFSISLAVVVAFAALPSAEALRVRRQGQGQDAFGECYASCIVQSARQPDQLCAADLMTRTSTDRRAAKDCAKDMKRVAKCVSRSCPPLVADGRQPGKKASKFLCKELADFDQCDEEFSNIATEITTECDNAIPPVATTTTPATTTTQASALPQRGGRGRGRGRGRRVRRGNSSSSSSSDSSSEEEPMTAEAQRQCDLDMCVYDAMSRRMSSRCMKVLKPLVGKGKKCRSPADKLVEAEEFMEEVGEARLLEDVRQRGCDNRGNSTPQPNPSPIPDPAPL